MISTEKYVCKWLYTILGNLIFKKLYKNFKIKDHFSFSLKWSGNIF